MIKNWVKGLLARSGYALVKTGRRSYGGEWDAYVRAARKKLERGEQAGEWPGDEWADRADWERTFQALIAETLPDSATRFVEIGQGSGKYSEMVLRRFPQSQLLCADVSSEFLAVLAERLREAVAGGRVGALLLDQKDPKQLLKAIEARGWLGTLDCCYSIDAMVHVDLQYQFAYWLTAAAALRPGGVLALTLADPTTDLGFNKLVDDVAIYFPQQGILSHKFEWVSPELVRELLTRLGFEAITISRIRPRDIYLSARLARRVGLRW